MCAAEWQLGGFVYNEYLLMVFEMDSVLILLASWMMALARHCRWDLHLLIMEAAFSFGCHSCSASDSAGEPWERLEIYQASKPRSFFGSCGALKGGPNASPHAVQCWIKRGKRWERLSGPRYVHMQLTFTPGFASCSVLLVKNYSPGADVTFIFWQASERVRTLR